MIADLHVDISGSGPAVIFIHGSFGSGADTFPEQRALSANYRVMLVDRRGYGQSAGLPSDGWPTDMLDVANLLDEVEEAHLVGQSYGGVVALLAAGLRPERVRSLVAIEPPAYEFALPDPHAQASVVALKPVYERAPALSSEEFVAQWAKARGMRTERQSEWAETLSEEDAEAARRERWPGDAPIDFDVLRAARFPKVLVRGAWRPEIVGREGLGKDFAAACRVLADRIKADVNVFEVSTHNPQLEEAGAFNALLTTVWSLPS